MMTTAETIFLVILFLLVVALPGLSIRDLCDVFNFAYQWEREAAQQHARVKLLDVADEGMGSLHQGRRRTA